MTSREERRAALEAQLAELDNEPEDDGIEYIDISEGDKSVRFGGKGALNKASRWLDANLPGWREADTEPAPETEPTGKAPKLTPVKDAEPEGKRAFGRRIG